MSNSNSPPAEPGVYQNEIIDAEKAQALIKEANELLAITVASIKTARKNRR